MAVRLNKYLADRGVGARRKCDQLIIEGRVGINGQPVREIGVRIDEQRDHVTVDGRSIGGRAKLVYYVLNKPVGVITTLDDPEGRRTIREFMPRGARVYPVGRLDADTSGLLLLTNDGDLAHKLMHPRYGVQKVYRVRLSQEPRGDQLRRLAGGVRFDKGLVSGPARVRRIDPGFDAIMIELIIHEGRFRQVRKMCETVGLPVSGLHRVGYGPIRLGPLSRGMFRELSEEEVNALQGAASRPSGSGRRDGAPRSERIAGQGDPRPVKVAATPPVRPTRPARPVRPAKPVSPVEDVVDPDEPDEIEDSWVAGGGFLPHADADPVGASRSSFDSGDEADDEDDADPDGVTYVGGRRLSAAADDDDDEDVSEYDGGESDDDDDDEVEEAGASLREPPAWPARSDRRRGDDAWQAEQSRPNAPRRPRQPEGGPPARERDAAPRARATGGVGRPAGRVGGARREAVRSTRAGTGPRRDSRPGSSARGGAVRASAGGRPAGRSAGPRREFERPARAGAEPRREFERPSRAKKAAPRRDSVRPSTPPRGRAARPGSGGRPVERATGPRRESDRPITGARGNSSRPGSGARAGGRPAGRSPGAGRRSDRPQAGARAGGPAAPRRGMADPPRPRSGRSTGPRPAGGTGRPSPKRGKGKPVRGASGSFAKFIRPERPARADRRSVGGKTQSRPAAGSGRPGTRPGRPSAGSARAGRGRGPTGR